MGIKKFVNKVSDKFKKVGLKLLSNAPKFNKVAHTAAKALGPVLTVASKVVPQLAPIAPFARPISAGVDLGVSLTDGLSKKVKTWSDNKLREIEKK